MFENLSERLSGVFDRLTKQGALSEDNVKTALREVRVALLEADVSLAVARNFVKAVQTKADDSVMEAHVSSDLRDMLGQILQPAGLSWDRELPAIAPPSADRPDD